MASWGVYYEWSQVLDIQTLVKTMGKTTDIQNSKQKMTFDVLTKGIRQLHEHFAAKAKHAVNVALTLRNWFIGFYIAEYQLHGTDRAKYGDKVVATLAQALKDVSNCSRQELYKYLTFYKVYPQIVGTVYRQLPEALMPSRSFPIVGTLSPQLEMLNAVNCPLDEKDGNWLISHLSYSHFDLLVGVEDATARAFYETECIRGCWSVRELKRQIGSMLYERTALSTNKRRMSDIANASAEHDTLAMTIRDPYVFDFLSGFCSARRKTMNWWNMPWRV
ncbi:MAG: hypothetical protein IJJ33_04550 [Victivallales bacterium]|nr:hypothetical protein [Victivallales bacterium]